MLNSSTKAGIAAVLSKDNKKPKKPSDKLDVEDGKVIPKIEKSSTSPALSDAARLQKEKPTTLIASKPFFEKVKEILLFVESKIETKSIKKGTIDIKSDTIIPKNSETAGSFATAMALKIEIPKTCTMLKKNLAQPDITARLAKQASPTPLAIERSLCFSIYFSVSGEVKGDCVYKNYSSFIFVFSSAATSFAFSSTEGSSAASLSGASGMALTSSSSCSAVAIERIFASLS